MDEVEEEVDVDEERPKVGQMPNVVMAQFGRLLGSVEGRSDWAVSTKGSWSRGLLFATIFIVCLIFIR